MTIAPSRALSIYDRDLDRNPANFTPLSPLTFLRRAARVYPARPAIVHGDRVITYAEKYDRARRFAGALAALGVGRGDTVAVLCPATPQGPPARRYDEGAQDDQDVPQDEDQVDAKGTAAAAMIPTAM